MVEKTVRFSVKAVSVSVNLFFVVIDMMPHLEWLGKLQRRLFKHFQKNSGKLSFSKRESVSKLLFFQI